MLGVAVWIQTKKRSVGVRYPWPRIASQRISALVPRRVKSSGGSGLRIVGSAASALGHREEPGGRRGLP